MVDSDSSLKQEPLEQPGNPANSTVSGGRSADSGTAEGHRTRRREPSGVAPEQGYYSENQSADHPNDKGGKTVSVTRPGLGWRSGVFDDLYPVMPQICSQAVATHSYAH